MNTSAFYHFIPTMAQLLGFAALSATVFAFVVVGAAVGGLRRFTAVDLYVGWVVGNPEYLAR